MGHVRLFVPLPRVLSHYSRELAETLRRSNVSTFEIFPAVAIDADDRSLVARGLSHARAVAGVPAGDQIPTLVLWPGFGWLEPAIWRGLGKKADIIVHDPVPIRRQRGGNPLAVALGRLSVRGGRVNLLCHTDVAAEATAAALHLDLRPPVCLHPILTMGDSCGPGSRETILVAGQYKPARDLDLLLTLGPRLKAADYRPRIVGRGWPRLAGWEVEDRFLSESELDAELRSAAAVLIPYRHYWQSGVAVRALENGAPVVGARVPFLESLLGSDYPAYADVASPSSWVEAVARSTALGGGLREVRRRYQQRVDESWAHFLDGRLPRAAISA